ncbi:MAG: DNA translocase FtsK [Ignavibacteria bacterium]|nr:DNA translocase FtsK [Ignavibacteria bacterium]
MSRSTKTKARETRRAKNEKQDFEISAGAKKQILGFLLIVFSVLLFLSIVTYSPKDSALIDTFDLRKLFNFKNPEQCFNWLGIGGAYVSSFLIKDFFGYYTIFIPVILFALGFPLLWKKPIGRYVQFSIFSFFMMVILGISTGLLKAMSGANTGFLQYAGGAGDTWATIFYRMMGGIGASVLFLFLLVLDAFLMIDGSIVKTLARLKLLFLRFIESFKKHEEDLTAQQEEKKIIAEEKKKDAFIPITADPVAAEKERIKKLKSSKVLPVDEADLIKETEINRPKEIEQAFVEIEKNPFEEITEEPKEEQKLIKPKQEIKSAGLKKKVKEAPKFEDAFVDTAINKADATEIDINPENSNELEGLKGRNEDDFEEEKLESFKYPGIDLLIEQTKEELEVIPDEELTSNGRLLQEKLLKFGIEIEKVFATPGPVVTLYELVPAADVKLSKIESLQDDIALAMKAKGIRMIIPIPGKGTVGVEIPNRKAQMVRIRSLVSSQKYASSDKLLPIAMGKTIDGEVFIDDLAKMPHVLIAGATGSGKSVGINTIIASLIYKMHPSDLKFVMIDPKKIELNLYAKLKKHYLASSGDINESIVTSPQNAVSILKSLTLEMDHRYDKLANAGVRNIEAYNQKYKDGKLVNNEFIRHKKMPYIVVIVDELADLMITAKKDIEEPIARLAQMARAVGIHLVVATQRPSTDVITGVIKANFPVRIAYQVASQIDSRTIMDMKGAEQLLRNGDMLYMSSSSQKPIRIQNAFISTDECERVAEFVDSQVGFKRPYLLPSLIEKRTFNGEDEERDELFEEAARLVVKLGQCSTSTLQRRLKLGYARAARIVDQMETAGIVGANNGAKGREILVGEEDLEGIFY